MGTRHPTGISFQVFFSFTEETVIANRRVYKKLENELFQINILVHRTKRQIPGVIPGVE